MPLTNTEKVLAIRQKYEKESENNDHKPKLTFLSLPRELRDKIYYLALLGYATLATPSDQVKTYGIMKLPSPPIAQVNQQMRHEALLVFYRNIHWRIDVSEYGLSKLQGWLYFIGRDNVKVLTQLRFTSGSVALTYCEGPLFAEIDINLVRSKASAFIKARVREIPYSYTSDTWMTYNIPHYVISTDTDSPVIQNNLREIENNVGGLMESLREKRMKGVLEASDLVQACYKILHY